MPALVSTLQQFNVVPALASPANIEELFALVNASDAADGDSSALDAEEFTELMVRCVRQGDDAPEASGVERSVGPGPGWGWGWQCGRRGARRVGDRVAV